MRCIRCRVCASVPTPLLLLRNLNRGKTKNMKKASHNLTFFLFSSLVSIATHDNEDLKKK